MLVVVDVDFGIKQLTMEAWSVGGDSDEGKIKEDHPWKSLMMT